MDQRENQKVVNTVTTQATHRVNMPPRRDVVAHIQAYPWGHPKEPDYWTGVYSTMRSPTRPQAAPCGAFWALIESPAQPGRGRNTGPRAAPEAHVNMAGKTGFDGPGENHKNPGKQGEDAISTRPGCTRAAILAKQPEASQVSGHTNRYFLPIWQSLAGERVALSGRVCGERDDF